MPEKPHVAPKALRRRIAPSFPLKLELLDDSGDTLIRNFRLSLDFNAACDIQARIGSSLLDGATWEDTRPITIATMLYAAILAHHPEYETTDGDGNPTNEGIEVLRSYMDAGNCKDIQNALFEAFVATLKPERQAEIRLAREEAAREAAAEKAAKAKLPNEAAAPAAAIAEPSLKTMPAAAASAS